MIVCDRYTVHLCKVSDIESVGYFFCWVWLYRAGYASCSATAILVDST